MIEVQQLCRRYGDFDAVKDVSFHIRQGEVVGLLGHNGAGKTTIMKMLTGYLEPTSGAIRIAGKDIETDTSAVTRHIGYLPENCPLWPEMTVIDYLEYQASLHGLDGDARRQAVARAIGRTALRDKAGQPIQTLSRGYRQRVGVAQAILHQPDIIILDEPTNGLDPTQISQMRGLIAELAESATVIVSTHILQEVQAVCERVLIMRGGQLVVDSRLDALQASHRLQVVVDNDDAGAYLQQVDGVKQVRACAPVDGHSCYSLEADGELAPAIAAAVQKAGDRLYRLQPEQRNLETVFAEVNGEQAKEAA